MKLATVSSVTFIVAGSLLVLMAQQLSLETVLPAVFTALGFVSIVTGFVLIFGTAVAVMLPQISRKLDLCQH